VPNGKLFSNAGYCCLYPGPLNRRELSLLIIYGSPLFSGQAKEAKAKAAALYRQSLPSFQEAGVPLDFFRIKKKKIIFSLWPGNNS
jgi:hypothetical protein